MTTSRSNEIPSSSKWDWMILSNDNYHWSKNKRQVLLKCVFVELLTKVEVSTSVKHSDESCPRISTQVVFTAAFLKILLTYLSCLAFLSLVRVCAICCGVLSAQENFLRKRELSTKGRQQRSLSRCLVIRLESSLGARSVAHRSLFLFKSFTVSR